MAALGFTAACIPSSLCHADGPCVTPFTCYADRQYRANLEVGCDALCGHDPCTGTVCMGMGPLLQCPANTVCVESRNPRDHFATSPCVDPSTLPDGGPDGGASDARSDASLDLDAPKPDGAPDAEPDGRAADTAPDTTSFDTRD